jgi:hypothetical protein
LADALLRLLRSAELRLQWGRNARTGVEQQFGIPSVTASLLSKYRQPRHHPATARSV